MITQIKNFYYDSIDSTNEESKRLIDSGKIKEISVIVADEQTKGKGTRGRTWVSPKGAGIYLSVIHVIARAKSPKQSLNEFRNEIASSALSGLPRNDTHFTKSAAIACVEAIKEICNIETKIKPINDIYADGKKLGGILVETRLNKNEISALITGIGINTHVACRGAIDRAHISIEELTQERFNDFSKEKPIEKIVEKVCFWHKIVFNGEFDKIEKVYSSLIL